MPRNFQTVPEELVDYADSFVDHFQRLGYRVSVEESPLEHPYTATFLARRPPTTVIVDVASRLGLDRIRDWTQYGRSCNRDTRVAIGVPQALAVTADEIEQVRALGAGLYRSSGREVIEVVTPQDLAVNVALPDLATLDPKLRRVLGAAYEQFSRTQWRDGFEDACRALEAEARRYLQSGMRSGRIAFFRPNGVQVQRTERQIDRMTIGQLAEAFTMIQRQNHADAVAGQVLTKINRDRIGVVHYRGRAAAERRLRDNVGRHMYLVLAGLRALLGVK